MSKETEKQYFVQVRNKLIEVNHDVYEELYQDQLYEKNQERKRRRKNVLSLDAMNEEKGEVYDFVPDVRSNTEEEAIKRIMITKISRILTEIDKENVILLKYIYEYSESEIASVLGISQAAVSKRKQKILEYLRSYMS